MGENDSWKRDWENDSQKKMNDEKRNQLHKALEGENPGPSGAVAVISLVAALLGFFFPYSTAKLVLLACALLLGIAGMIGRKKWKGLGVASVVISLYSLFTAVPMYFLLGNTGNLASLPGGMPETETVWAEEVPREETTAEIEEISARLSTQELLLPKELVLISQNNGEKPVSLDYSVVFYGESGEMLSLEERYFYDCFPGGKAIVSVSLPHDRDYNLVPFDHYELQIDAEEEQEDERYLYFGNEFQITSNIGTEGTVLVSVINPTGETFDAVDMCCLYYSGDDAVGYASLTLTQLGEKAVVVFDHPRDESFNPVAFDRYEIFVVSTERYDA